MWSSRIEVITPVTPSRSIGVRELKAHASTVLREMQASGQDVIVTVRGRPVARISPVMDPRTPKPDGMGGLKGALQGDWPDLNGEDFVEAKRIWEPRPIDER